MHLAAVAGSLDGTRTDPRHMNATIDFNFTDGRHQGVVVLFVRQLPH